MSIPRSLVRFASIAVVAALATVGSALPSSATDVNVSGVAVHEATAIGFAEGVEAAVNQSVGFEVECPADGECVAAGILTDAATPANQQVWVAVRYGGVWGMGQVVTFPAGSFLEGFIGGQELSCSGVGECDLVGNREGAAGGQLAFHARVANGVAQAAEWMTVAGVTTSTPEMTMVAAITCVAPGACTVVGSTMDVTPNPRAVEWTITGGVAAAGTPISLPASLVDAAAPESDAFAVECIAAGECVETGVSTPVTGPAGWIRVQAGGVWGEARAIAFPAGSLGTGAPGAGMIECWAVGECMVGGTGPSVARGEASTPFALAVSGGVPQIAQFLALDPSDPSTDDAYSAGLSCRAAGTCSLAFTVSNQNGSRNVPEVSSSVDGVWGTAVALAGMPNASSNYAEGIDCVRVGECELVGHFKTPSASGSFIAVQTGGVWQAPVTMTAASPLLPTDIGGLHGVTCVSGGTNCVSIGRWQEDFQFRSVPAAGGTRPMDAEPSATGEHAITQSSVFPPAPAPTPEPVGPKYTG